MSLPGWTTNRALAVAAGVLGTLALVAGDTPPPGGAGEMTALELAATLREDADAVVVLDVRDEAAYEDFHAPRALHVSPDAESVLAAAQAAGAGEAVPVVVTGGPAADPRPGWLALRRAGHARAYYVRDILTSWLDEIISPVLSPDASETERIAWAEQSELAKYFGGFPRIAETNGGGEPSGARLRKAKRRGCAF